MANIIPTNHAHMRIGLYIKVPYFTSFRFPASSIVGLGLGTVLVLFFIAFFPFRYMLKDRKLLPPQVPLPWHSDGAVFVLCLLSYRSGVRIPACYLFFTFFKSSLSKFSVTVSFSLKITFRVTVNFNM